MAIYFASEKEALKDYHAHPFTEEDYERYMPPVLKQRPSSVQFEGGSMVDENRNA